MRKEQCRTCQFWEGDRFLHDDKIYEDRSDIPEPQCGFCHRYPPTVVFERADVSGTHIVTDDDDWCGEWRDKNK